MPVEEKTFLNVEKTAEYIAAMLKIGEDQYETAALSSGQRKKQSKCG